MSAPGRPEPVTKQLVSCSFGFFTDEETKSFSVKRITNPVLFDNLRNPQPDGLYDSAMGPLESHGSCSTCRLGYFQCPGHFGRIELAVPVYNPLVFKTTLKLLKCVCLHCFRFKLAAERVERYCEKMELIQLGDLASAMAVGMGPAGVAAKIAKDFDIKVGGKKDSKKKKVRVQPPGGRIQWTVHTVEVAKSTIADFLRKMPPGKCENCNANVPVMSQQGHSRIFQMPLSSKKARANQMNGTQVRSTLGGDGAAAAMSAMEDEAMADYMGGGGGEAEGGSDGSDADGESLDQQEAKLPKKSAAKEDLREAAAEGLRPRYVTPAEVKEILSRLWGREGRMLDLIYAADQFQTPGKGAGSGRRSLSSPDMFFIQVLPVAPNKFRPPSVMGDITFEHAQNVLLTRILNTNLALTSLAGGDAAGGVGMDVAKATQIWLDLQKHVNGLLDSSAGGPGVAGKDETPGIRQQLEKKEGLFRKNMMGKRVNYACRSVISPDPYIATNEIGVPPYFASRLTFPEHVTPWNVEALREAVERGPAEHPGALHVEDEHGRLISLATMSQPRRVALAKTLLSTPSAASVASGRPKGARGKVVYRHLRDGDVVLVNRQPTLHKPGVMAHKVKVLKGQKTIRMHYANCSTYNADFDGDEMNLHFVQDHYGRSEAYNIVNADEQFIVPTDGKPIRGLIQDHIVSAVLMTRRDTFFNKAQYQQLVYEGCSALAMADGGGDRKLPFLPPALWKPRKLWTGKQVLTSVLMFLSEGRAPVTMSCNGKTPPDYFGKSYGEGEFHVYKGEVVHGVLDKAQFGKFGLVHAFHQVYGPTVSGQLLSALSRLFTYHLQMKGFTCGMDDLIVIPKAEAIREAHLKTANNLGLAATSAFCKVKEDDDEDVIEAGDALSHTLGAQLRGRPDTEAVLDMRVSSAMSPLTSAVIKTCLPAGQYKPFRHNQLSLMTMTGAKGSMVNFSQISALLGQQELEGRRVPRMPSGKTLPCFQPHDVQARAGGFIGDRFLTGLRPQDYFHCMAGRDGLVDTTVKTSRSGYLQRCLVKNLESLRVHYDLTVRDCDKSIVQFYYGEDALDVTKISYLKNFEFLAANAEGVAMDANLEAATAFTHNAAAEEEICRIKGSSGQPQYPVMSQYSPAAHLGSVSESFDGALERFVKSNPGGKLTGKKKKKSKKGGEGGGGGAGPPSTPEGFTKLMELLYMRALTAPGEAVGVLAAQSMTLNTFHFAGRGEANVTMGIPRLREILMTAAQVIKTPVVTLPMLDGLDMDDAERLAGRLRRIQMAEVLKDMSVVEAPCGASPGNPGGHSRSYTVRLRFHQEDRYPEAAAVKFSEISTAFQKVFMPKLKSAVKAVLKRVQAGGASVGSVTVSKGGDDVAIGGGDDEVPDGPVKQTDVDREEEEEEEEEGARQRGGRGEKASYDEGDAEEAAIAEATRREAMAAEGDVDDDEEAGVADEGEDGAGGPAAPAKARRGESAQDKSLVGGGKVDAKRYTCECIVSLPLDCPKIIMLEVAERVVANVVVRFTPGITGANALKPDKEGDPPRVQVLGSNFEGIWQHQDVGDVDNLTTNDIGAVLRTYGVEAARACIMSEVRGVFGMYGIGVDPRHLSLIADFMTHQGGYRACNRLGIETSPSPFLKMSFETAAHFLCDATLAGNSDTLESPSSRIVVGRVVDLGTGSFDLRQNFSKNFSKVL